jgi:2,3-bisphosphoglycerate-independent phosphoglycerate mutase
MENKIKKAVILVAGFGSRLKPFTDEMPKCLTEINGRPILIETLDMLERNGIEEAVIVVGYLGDIVIDKIGKKFRHMKVSYIWNKIFDKTNSMYSVWLARNYLEKGAILIEGDTIFKESLIKSALETEEDKAYWILDKFTKKYNGSMSIANEEGRIIDLKIVREQLRDYKDNYFKSTGVLKITPKYGKLFSKWLDEDVQKGNIDIYYDLVIAKHLKDYPIYVHDITGQTKWAEIDDFSDLRQAEEIFRSPRYVVVLIDGAADSPIPELNNKTPLEAANIPNIDFLAKNGKTGIMQTMYLGLPLGSIVANLGILGYNPLRYYPNGRASFEALAKGIYLDNDDIAFRCNLLSLKEGRIADFTANNINNINAHKIIDNIKVPDDKIKLYPGQSYRNLLILKNTEFNSGEIKAFEPHMNVGKKVKDLLLQGTTEKSKKTAAYLNNFMMDTIEQLSALNKKFNTYADMLFLWSPSSVPTLSSFHRKFGIDGAIVAGLDFLKGIGIAARMAVKKTKGSTGYSNTDLKEKLKDAQNHLIHNDLVFIHINAPDEESHNGNVKNKIQIIEKIDKQIVGPMIDYLNDRFRANYRIALLPDHYTYLKDGKHGERPVPYLLYGEGIEKDNVQQFSEREIEKSSKGIIKSYEFMNYLLIRELSKT